MNSIYNVPVIPENLRREETIVKIAECLVYLQEVSVDIFERINQRVEKNQKYLSNISERINTAGAQVKKLSEVKSATQVFSSSKYPATNLNKNHVSIFKNDQPLHMKRFNVEYKNVNVKDEPMESLLFYHVKVKDGKINNRKGLGKVPRDIRYLNDLLLFNSGKNIYNNYDVPNIDVFKSRIKKNDNRNFSQIGNYEFIKQFILFAVNVNNYLNWARVFIIFPYCFN